jgi:hypothetical protein
MYERGCRKEETSGFCRFQRVKIDIYQIAARFAEY